MACNTAICPEDEPVDCTWGEWGSFSACPVSCGGGEMVRKREVLIPAKQGGRPCNASATAEYARCNLQPCSPPRTCAWASWSSWGDCSASCGGGQRKRTRALQVKIGQLAEGVNGVIDAVADAPAVTGPLAG